MKKIFLPLLLLWIFTVVSTAVKAQLKADFAISHDTICSSVAENFVSSPSGGTRPYLVLWDFGDGDTSTNARPSHIYDAGNYKVTLHVLDAKNNIASITKSITVLALPIADFSTTVLNCGNVYFQASQAATSPTTISSYLWEGQGATGYGPLYATGKIGTYQYTRGGNYHYTLEVTAPNGCSRTYNDSLKISPFPGISLPNDTAVCNDSQTVTITSKLLTAYQPYHVWWNVKDNKGDSLTTGSIIATITHDTSFRVNLQDQGCTNYDSIKIKAIAKPSLGPDQRGCWNHPILLSTGLPHEPTVNWTWISGNDTVSNPNHGDTIMVADSGTYIVNVQDSMGCFGTDTVNVSFNPLVKAINLDTSVCYGDSVTLTAGTAGPGATYTWIDRVHINVISTKPVYKFWISDSSGYSLGAFFETVIRQTLHGVTCTDTGYITVKVIQPSNSTLKDLLPECIDNTPFRLATDTTEVDSSHMGGTWYYPRKPSAVINNFLYPAVMGETDNNLALGYVHYLYTNKSGCISNDSTRIIISNLPTVYAGPDTEICTGNSKYLLSNGYISPPGGTWVAMNGTPSNAVTYSPHRDSVFFDPSAPGVSDTVYGVVYSYQGHSTQGGASCSNSDTVFITVVPLPDAHWTMTYFGDSAYFHAKDSSLAGLDYHWDFGDGNSSSLPNPKHLYSSIGNYTVSLKVKSTAGCMDSFAQKISIPSFVWPGDANDDKTVDMNDLLNIGIAYGTVGHPRPSANISWTAQPSLDWDSSFSNGVNYKYADCNGDSIINDEDTAALSANYGKSHSKTLAVEQGSPSDPPFAIKPATDTVYAGDTLKATFMIGNATQPVQNLYGILFSLSANLAYFETDHAMIQINPSFLGKDGANLIGMKIYNASKGLIDIGLTRIDHKNVSGYGDFATIYLPVKATLPQKEYKTALGISGNNQISYNGKNVPLYFTNDSVVILQDKSGVQNTISQPLPKLNIYPNPFNASITLKYVLNKPSKVTIGLYDITGKQIGIIEDEAQSIGQYSLVINAEKYHLAQGVYLLKFMTDDGYVSKHIVKL